MPPSTTPIDAETIELALRDPVYRRRVADFLALGLQLLAEAPEHSPRTATARVAALMARLDGSKRAAR